MFVNATPTIRQATAQGIFRFVKIRQQIPVCGRRILNPTGGKPAES